MAVAVAAAGAEGAATALLLLEAAAELEDTLLAGRTLEELEAAFVVLALPPSEGP